MPVAVQPETGGVTQFERQPWGHKTIPILYFSGSIVAYTQSGKLCELKVKVKPDTQWNIVNFILEKHNDDDSLCDNYMFNMTSVPSICFKYCDNINVEQRYIETILTYCYKDFITKFWYNIHCIAKALKSD